MPYALSLAGERDACAHDAVPALRFHADNLPCRDRFAAWCETMGGLFDVAPLRGGASGDCRAGLTAYHLGPLLLCHSRVAAARYVRSDIRILWDDLDHYLVHVPLAGAVGFRRRGAVARLRPMDVGVLDLSQPATLLTGGGEAVSLVLPRSALPSPLAQAGRLHGRVVPGDSPEGALLGHHLAALAREVPRLARAAAAGLAAASLALAGACLGGGGAAGPEQPELPERRSLGRRMRAYIERNLHQAALGPDALTKDLGVSRSQLYRQFERFGGVQHYIRQRRLRRSLLAVCDPLGGDRRIAELAYAHGFADEGHFSRLFRQSFGMSPRAARNAARRGEPVALAVLAADGASLTTWLRDLSL